MPSMVSLALKPAPVPTERFTTSAPRFQASYVSQRIPFAYDYYSRDDGVATTNNHGTHVTALAAGYVKDRAGHVPPEGRGWPQVLDWTLAALLPAAQQIRTPDRAIWVKARQ